jgi:hypothetical protein
MAVFRRFPNAAHIFAISFLINGHACPKFLAMGLFGIQQNSEK